jgi:hypothetical protein
MKSGVWVAVLAMTVAGAAAGDGKKTFQCWTDENGKRMCGDAVPPQYSGKKREVLNDRGQVIETKTGAPTQEELAEKAKKEKAAEEAKKREEYDRSLLQTYRNVKDIENMRSERLALIDARIAATNKIRDENSASLKSLQDRAEQQAKANKPVDERLAKQIKQYDKLVSSNGASLERMAKERQNTDATFTRDLQRYAELRGIKLDPTPAAAPAAASAEPAKPPPAAAKADAKK